LTPKAQSEKLAAMKQKKVNIGALIAPQKRNALRSRLAARGETFQEWIERLIDREINWSESRTVKGQ